MVLSSDLEPLYSAAIQELKAANLDLAEAQRRASDAETRVKLLDGLLALSSRGDGERVEPGPSHTDVIDAVVDILKAQGSPMTIREIREELLARSIPLPGKGEAANLIARFQRSSGRIVRIGRGLYDIQRVGGSPTLIYDDGRAVRLKSVTRLGKSDECEIVLSDSTVSQIQALITVQHGSAVIGNAGDQESLKVNGKPLANPVLLAAGDRISIGDTELTYQSL